MPVWLQFLLDSAVKGTIILGLAAVAASWLRRGSAASRHLVWHLAVIGLLALPVISAALPESAHLPVLPRIGRVAQPASQPSNDNGLISNATTGGPVSAPSRAQSVESVGALTDDDASVARAASSASAGWHLPSLPLTTWLLIVWAVGAVLVLARYALGTLVVHWFTWRAKPVNAIAWASLNETMSFAVGLGHPVRLLKSERATTPMTFGVLNPVVLLPNDAEEWGEERRRVVLLHELAHVQRLDCLTNIFATIACAVYWFNPLVWIAVNRMRAEGERACDDWVLRAGMRASTYAEHLLDMVKTIGRLHTPAAALPMAQRSTFEGRLLAILEPDMNRNGTRRGQAVLLTSVIALVVLPLAAMTSPAQASAADTKTTADAVGHTAIPVGKALSALGTKVGLFTKHETPTASLNPLSGTNKDSDRDADADKDAVSSKDSENAWTSQQAGVSAVRINALVGALVSADNDVRRASATSLGQLGDPRSVAALSNALRTDKDASVRRAAAWALGQIGDAKAVPALNDALKGDSDIEVRRTAAWASGQIGSATSVDALAAAIRESDKELRSTAVWALGQIGEASAVPALSSAIKDSDPSIRNQAAWALGQIGERSGVAALTTGLHDSSAEVRATSVWALGQIGDESAVTPLTSLLGDNDANVRKQAIWALGQIGSGSSVPAISSLLRNESDVGARETATWALGQIGEESGAAALGAVMKDAAPSVRSSAAWALGQIGHSPAPQALVDALRDENVDVRRTTVWALGQIEDRNAVGALRNAMKDTDADVRRGAMRALMRLGDESALDALSEMLKDTDPAVRKQAAEALGGHGGGWVDPRPRPRPQPRPAPRPRPFGG
jgi:HEAT repeat protein/beta-lactamase regulating signal transducer with metallopeptidase domain